MRYMPSYINDEVEGEVEVPQVPENQWLAKIEELLGRAIRSDEMEQVNEMANHNWTATVVADELRDE